MCLVQKPARSKGAIATTSDALTFCKLVPLRKPYVNTLYTSKRFQIFINIGRRFYKLFTATGVLLHLLYNIFP